MAADIYRLLLFSFRRLLKTIIKSVLFMGLNHNCQDTDSLRLYTGLYRVSAAD